MGKAHDVQSLSFSEAMMILRADGRKYTIDVAKQSQKLADATPEQRETFVVSPSGYGIHWPDLDEDLSIDGLIGIAHSCPGTTANA